MLKFCKKTHALFSDALRILKPDYTLYRTLHVRAGCTKPLEGNAVRINLIAVPDTPHSTMNLVVGMADNSKWLIEEAHIKSQLPEVPAFLNETTGTPLRYPADHRIRLLKQPRKLKNSTYEPESMPFFHFLENFDRPLACGEFKLSSADQDMVSIHAEHRQLGMMDIKCDTRDVLGIRVNCECDYLVKVTRKHVYVLFAEPQKSATVTVQRTGVKARQARAKTDTVITNRIAYTMFME